MPFPPLYIINPQPDYSHTHTIILLHGLGSTASQFATDLFSHKSSDPYQTLASALPNFRWVFPDAGDLQIPGLKECMPYLKSVIESEVESLGGNSEHVVLGGFSQGSATALWTFLTGSATVRGKLGAFIGLGTWLPLPKDADPIKNVDSTCVNIDTNAQVLMDTLLRTLDMAGPPSKEAIIKAMHDTPAFLGHGIDDEQINLKHGHAVRHILQAVGTQVEWKDYVGAEREGHWIKEPEEFDDIIAFVQRQCRGE
ncbi:alpha/beta-hydrolase [Mytilinidion resinicola]|uniref:Alpha/beta-hydrolase n=1 Tax=Mytilinidion resinicola TaxID=574789 RepID=A0A6A6YMF8_9PEZI|nr:alpha/beta-hydrolase [Mytilinidion resinicola]KAF2810062.1 alpha/beta-hydrolase [Mytilinidion resinicola]